MIEYYLPGVDASQLSDNALAMKLAHLGKIRQMENNDSTSNLLNNLFGGK